jgi:hypothetical protein
VAARRARRRQLEISPRDRLPWLVGRGVGDLRADSAHLVPVDVVGGEAAHLVPYRGALSPARSGFVDRDAVRTVGARGTASSRGSGVRRTTAVD